MSELITFAIPFVIGIGIGIFVGMGLQVKLEERWFKKLESGRGPAGGSGKNTATPGEDQQRGLLESGRSVKTQRRSTPQIDSDGSPPRVRNGSPKTDRPDS